MDLGLLANNPLFGAYEQGIYFFSLPIQYYAMFIVTGMVVAAVLSALMMKRRNLDNNFIYLLFICCIPTAIIGARLFSCLTDPKLGIGAFFDFPWAGLSITGGVIGGVLAGLIVCLVCKVNFLRVADCIVVNILLAQAIGRWGNFFNKEVYGGIVENPALWKFPLAVPVSPDASIFGVGSFSDPNSTWHYAFFFYEMVINLIGWAILFTFTWFRKKKPNGISTCLYFVWYGTVRSIMEPLRDKEFILNGGDVMWSELFAILMAGLGLAAILVLLIVNHQREGSFVGSLKGDPCGITKYLSNDKKATPYFSKINMMGASYPPAPPKEKKKRGKTPAEEPSEEVVLERPRPAPLTAKRNEETDGEAVKTDKTDTADGEET